MLRTIFLIIKFMPIWSVITALILGESGVILYRKGRRAVASVMILFALLNGALCAMFFLFKWGKTLYPWIREQW